MDKSKVWNYALGYIIFVLFWAIWVISGHNDDLYLEIESASIRTDQEKLCYFNHWTWAIYDKWECKVITIYK